MSETSPALADALRRLKTAERTEAELRKSLSAKHEEDEVEAALVWLKDRRLLSETRAVEATVRPRSTGRRAEGDARLRERLITRGAEDTVIEQALAALPSETDRMQEALVAKFSPNDPSQRGKAGRHLLSRGFDEEGVAGALDRFFGDEADGLTS